MGKDDKIRRLAVRKACSGKKVKDMAGQPSSRISERSKDRLYSFTLFEEIRL